MWSDQDCESLAYVYTEEQVFTFHPSFHTLFCFKNIFSPTPIVFRKYQNILNTFFSKERTMIKILLLCLTILEKKNLQECNADNGVELFKSLAKHFIKKSYLCI